MPFHITAILRAPQWATLTHATTEAEGKGLLPCTGRFVPFALPHCKAKQHHGPNSNASSDLSKKLEKNKLKCQNYKKENFSENPI